jgi:hypothetical protein
MKTKHILAGVGVAMLVAIVNGSRRPETASANSPTPANPQLFCQRATEVLRTRCPRVTPHITDNCSTSKTARVGLLVESSEIARALPGSFFKYDSPAEWYLGDNGVLLAINGPSHSACDNVPYWGGYLAAWEREHASVRGDSPKTYEGTWDANGNAARDDCSTFEMRVAIEDTRTHSLADESDEHRSMRVAQKLGLSQKVFLDIIGKSMFHCLRATNDFSVDERSADWARGLVREVPGWN